MEHSEPRATKDLDILIACNKKNAKLVFGALKEFGGQLSGIDDSFFATKGRFYKIGRPPNRIDIITSADGCSFSKVWKNKVQRVIKGVAVTFISIDDLIKLKQAASRPQDLIDIEKLKLYKKLRKKST